MSHELKTMQKLIDIQGIHEVWYFDYQGVNYQYPGERHNFWEMVYIDSGSAYVTAETASFVLKQGDVLFHKPMEFHAIGSYQNKPHNVMIVSFTASGKSDMSFFESGMYTLDARLKKILALLLGEARMLFGAALGVPLMDKLVLPDDYPPASGQLLIGYLEEFLLLLQRAYSSESADIKSAGVAKKTVDDSTAELIDDFLSENLYRTVTLEMISQHFQASIPHLCKLYKNATGESIINTFNKMKCVEAKKLIRHGEMNFTQIAEKMGYSSIYQFTRSFKAICNMPPSEYTKSIQ